MKVGVISNNDLCLPLLYYLKNNKADPQLYFSDSLVNDPKRNDVLQLCGNYSIPVHTDAHSPDSLYSWLNSTEPDLVFVLSHLHRIDVKRIPVPLGIFNIHFGKLPQFRGASPVFWQLKKMEANLGLSIHALTDRMDAGAVYWKKEIRNEEHFTYSYVQYLFSHLLLEGVNSMLEQIHSSSPFQLEEQDETKACWFARP